MLDMFDEFAGVEAEPAPDGDVKPDPEPTDVPESEPAETPEDEGFEAQEPEADQPAEGEKPPDAEPSSAEKPAEGDDAVSKAQVKMDLDERRKRQESEKRIVELEREKAMLEGRLQAHAPQKQGEPQPAADGSSEFYDSLGDPGGPDAYVDKKVEKAIRTAKFNGDEAVARARFPDFMERVSEFKEIAGQAAERGDMRLIHAMEANPNPAHFAYAQATHIAKTNERLGEAKTLDEFEAACIAKGRAQLLEEQKQPAEQGQPADTTPTDDLPKTGAGARSVGSGAVSSTGEKGDLFDEWADT